MKERKKGSEGGQRQDGSQEGVADHNRQVYEYVSYIIK